MFFDILQALCDEKGIAMSSLLDSVGMSRGNIARWKNGLVPKAATKIKLAEALGVDRERLEEKTEKDLIHTDKVLDDEDIKFALFGGGPVTDKQYEEVKQFVRFIKERDAHDQNQ